MNEDEDKVDTAVADDADADTDTDAPDLLTDIPVGGRVGSGHLEKVLRHTLGKKACTKLQATAAWTALLGVITEAIQTGRTVSLVNVGTLEPYVKKPTNYREAGGDTLRRVPARRYVRFIPATSLKQALKEKKI